MVSPQQLRWYAAHLPLVGATVADVGAHRGALSAFFWQQVGPSGAVVSIEPLRSNVAALRERIAACGAGNWRVEAVAVSDRDGEVGLVTAQFDDGPNAVVAAHGTVRVPARRLPELVPAATVVKLDIEGHEYAVLDDALGRMPQVRAWALELHMVPGRPLPGVLGQLRDHGYVPRIAGRAAAEPDGPWRAVEVPAGLDWSAIPAVAGRASRDGGGAAAVKVIHVIAGARGDAANG